MFYFFGCDLHLVIIFSAKKDRPDEGGDEGEAAGGAAAADVNTESQD